MKEIKFTAKIVCISSVPRYQITIPKKLVDEGYIDPESEYEFKLIPKEREDEEGEIN